MLNLGYLGGVYDAGTCLIYMGNGQYYDPSTGRFLTRGAQQDQSNPYTPWNSDPAGMLIAPLALLALAFGRKKTRTKFDQFIILFVIVLSVGLSVSACGYDIEVISTPTSTMDPTDAAIKTFIPTGEYILQLTDEAGTDTKVIVEVSETPAPKNTSTATLEPGCNGRRTSDDPMTDYATMLLNAIKKQQSDLPDGFSIALLLGMAAKESGGNSEPYRNSNYNGFNEGGEFQLRKSSGNLNQDDYTDDQAGYDANVRDALLTINENYGYAITNSQESWGDYAYLNSLYPNKPDKVIAAMTVLFYNGGTNWKINYKTYSDNIPYVGQIAGFIETYVPSYFGYCDTEIIDVLKSLQNTVNVYFPNG